MSLDTDWGAFREGGPWNLVTDEVEWLPVAERLRQHAAGEVPRLVTPSRLPSGSRALTVVAVLARRVAPWFARRRQLPSPAARRADIAHRLRLAAQQLGPTYIKLAQIISGGEGLFPAELVDELKLCRDRVPPEPFHHVRRVVEAELGRPLGEVFAHIDEAPLAAASIAQVHAATLRSGERVVVKVQRPHVSRTVRRDLRAMAWLAPHLVGRIPVSSLANPPALVELFAETIVEELDFRIEAANMIDVATMLRDVGQDSYVVPRPHPTLVTRRVLVMERLDGFGFDDVEGMAAAGIDTEQVVRTAMIALMEGAMVEGVFHGDLHGGNLLVLSDGRTALLDFGIVGRLARPRRLAFLRLMLGAMTNDPRSQVAAMRDLGALRADVDVEAVVRDLRLDEPATDPTSMSGEQLVTELKRLVNALLGYGARMPKELMLYVKNLVFIDGAIARLAPDLDMLGEIVDVSTFFAERHGERLGRDLGIDAGAVTFDLGGIKAGFGVEAGTERLTHRELRARREEMQRRMRDGTG